MTLKKFIKENRQEIDNAIKSVCPNARYFNDEERRNWVYNDQSLYSWARSCGCRI